MVPDSRQSLPEEFQWGPIKFIRGENNGRFSYCNSLILDDGEALAVFDPGAGEEPLRLALGERFSAVTDLIGSHYHYDHVWGNRFFPRARTWLNTPEIGVYDNLSLIGKMVGIEEFYGPEAVGAWLKELLDTDLPQFPITAGRRHDWAQALQRGPEAPKPAVYPVTVRPNSLAAGVLPPGAPTGTWQLGRTRVEMVFSPGHSVGLSCAYFPEYGVVQCADIDLTGFGPWYSEPGGGIDLYIESARRIASLNADWFVTGHQRGVFRRADFLAALDPYLEIIEIRDAKIRELAAKGLSVEEIARRGVLYQPRFHDTDPWAWMWEMLTVRKHLERSQTR